LKATTGTPCSSCSASVATICSGALGRDAVDGGGAGRDRYAGVQQPGVEDRRHRVADEAHRGRDDAVRLAVDSRRLQVKCGEAALVPAHGAEA
jgi:hypothetical protein